MNALANVFSALPRLPADTGLPLVLGVAAILLIASLLFEANSIVRHQALRKRRARYKHGMASALMYARHVRPNLISLSNGGYLAVYEMRAPDGSAYSAHELALADAALARAIGQFTSGMVVHCHYRSAPYREYDMREDAYPSPYFEFLDRCRQAEFTSGKHFRSRRVVSIAWEPPNIRAQRLKAAASTGIDAIVKTDDELIEQFEEILSGIEPFFKSQADVYRLTAVREADSFGTIRTRSPVLEHLDWCVSGKDRHIVMPVAGQAINGYLAQTFRIGSDVKVGDMETATVVVKGFPDATYPLMFQKLSDLGIDFSLVVRWMPLDASEAKAILRTSHGEWTQTATENKRHVDAHAVDMAESARQALAYVADGGQMGVTNVTVVIRGLDRKVVSKSARDIVAMLDDIGFPSIISSLTAEDDYFGSLPGDGYHGVYKYALNTLNIAHIFSWHEEGSGRRKADSPTLPARQPALVYARAGNASTLYHVNLNDIPRDVFHFYGVGGTGSGKSTASAHIAAQWVGRMPHGGYFGIDRGLSSYRLTRFLDGNFYNLMSEHNAPGFALFSGVDDPINRAELLDMLENFVTLQSPGVVKADERKRMEEAMVDGILGMPVHLRSLTAYVEEFLQDPKDVLRPALRNYCRNGRLGRTLDSEQDSFSTSMFNSVDIGLVWKMKPMWLIPMLTTLLWKSRQQVAALKIKYNRPDLDWLTQIDEAHTLLGNEFGCKFIHEDLKMGRRDRRTLGLWSNGIGDYVQSPIWDTIVEQCKTRFYARNLDVIDSEKMRKMYSDTGLSTDGIQWLPNIAEYSMLMHQPASRELQEIAFSFDRATLAIIGRSHHTDNVKLDAYMRKYPQTWRQELMHHEGVAGSVIDEMLEIVAKHNVSQRSLSIVASV